MKKTIKSHPLMFFYFLKPVLFFLLVPSVKAAIQIIFFKTVGGFYYIEAAIFLFLSFLAELRRRNHLVDIYDESLVFKKGVYFKKQTQLLKDKITALYVKQNPIERLFSAKTVFINSVAENEKGYTFKITLGTKDAKTITDFISTGERQEEQKFSFWRVAFWAAAASSTAEGILLFAPTFGRFANLFGIGVYSAFKDLFADRSLFADKYIHKATNGLTIAFVFIYLFVFFYQVIKNLGFGVIKSKNMLLVKSGIIVKRRTVFNINTIAGVFSEQTFLMRILKCYILKVLSGGYMGKYSGRGIICPCLKAKELKFTLNKLFCVDLSQKCEIDKVKARFGVLSAMLVPVFLILIVIILSVCIFIVFENFRRLIVFTAIIFVLVLLLCVEILVYGYYKSGVFVGEDLLFIGTKRFKTKKMCLKRGNIGFIKLKQNPFDRKRGSCKLKVFFYPINTDAVVLRWINYAGVLEIFTKKE